MKIKIGNKDNLPEGEYELTSREKLENAKGNLPFGPTDRQILIEYDRIAGRVVKDGVVLSPQSLWSLERQHQSSSIEQFSDAELLAVIRRAENTDVPGSLYQKANNEWQLRQQQRILEATQNKGGVFFEVGGNMTNHGVIQADKGTTVNIAVAGDYSSNKRARIVQGNMATSEKPWYEKPFGIVVLAIVSALIAGGFLFWLGWN